MTSCPDFGNGKWYNKVSDNTCDACDVTCATCNGANSDNCLSCSGSYYLDGTSCVNSCPDGEYTGASN